MCLHAVEDLRLQPLSLPEAQRIREVWGAHTSLGVSSRVDACVRGSGAEGRRHFCYTNHSGEGVWGCVVGSRCLACVHGCPGGCSSSAMVAYSRHCRLLCSVAPVAPCRALFRLLSPFVAGIGAPSFPPFGGRKLLPGSMHVWVSSMVGVFQSRYVCIYLGSGCFRVCTFRLCAPPCLTAQFAFGIAF